jgi:hypothetical protein
MLLWRVLRMDKTQTTTFVMDECEEIEGLGYVKSALGILQSVRIESMLCGENISEAMQILEGVRDTIETNAKVSGWHIP